MITQVKLYDHVLHLIKRLEYEKIGKCKKKILHFSNFLSSTKRFVKEKISVLLLITMYVVLFVYNKQSLFILSNILSSVRINIFL